MSDDHSSALRLITPPLSEPLTLAQAKAFLRIEHTADDDAIAAAIATARQFAENYMRTAFLAQTWEYTVANPCQHALTLPIGPATSIISVTLTNPQGTTATMDTGNYRLSVDGYSVLFTNRPLTEKLAVRFVVASYASATDIPALILQGMLHHIAALMEHRDGIIGLPVQAVNCYQPFRRVTL